MRPKLCGLTMKNVAPAVASNTANSDAVRMTTSSSVIRRVSTGVADGALYWSCSSPALGVRVSNVA